MSDKYYTPKIEEFHIGFEYEWLNEDNKWIKENTPIEISQEGFDEQTYGLRVKYLNKEDIESLGFNIKTTSYGIYYVKNQYKIEYSWDKKLIISENNKMIVNEIFEHQGNILFMGYIKNKSELKRLLTQLDII